MSKEHVIEFVLEVYQINKQTKQHIEYLLDPNEKEMLEKYRKIIIEEFYPTKGSSDPKLRFAVCKKAIAEFKSLKPAPENLADLLVTLSETTCEFIGDFSSIWEEFYDSTATNFIVALKYLEKNGLLEPFEKRCAKCVKHVASTGYGFEDSMGDIYSEYYKK